MKLFQNLSLILALAAGTNANLKAHQPLDLTRADLSAVAAEAGGQIVRGRVQAGCSVAWDLTLQAGRFALLLLRGDRTTNLDIYLFDENGGLIDFDESFDDQESVCVTPRWTGKFTAVIVNRGIVYNDYTLQLV